MARTDLAPLLLRPRLDLKPWGGRALERFGLALPPDESVGEAVATAADAVVAHGPWAEQALGDVIAADPAAFLGNRGLAVSGGRILFPLVVKFLDARENLSIQVHPDDEAARPHHRLGKTEAWHVLAADPGSWLYLGLRPDVAGDAFGDACREGTGAAAHCLRRIPAVPGTTVLLPAGTAHALGAGVVVYEIQQASDVTYRLHDWDRRDAAGQPRELHVDQGLAALHFPYRPERIAPIALATGAGRRHLLAACRVFALERIALAAGEEVTCPIGSPQTLTCLRGSVIVETNGGSADLNAGETAVVAAVTPCRLRAVAPAVLLRAWVPDLAADVIAPTRTSGADDEEIAALAGPLPDLRDLLSG